MGLLKQLSEKTMDSKSRTIIIFVGVLILAGAFIAVSNMETHQPFEAVDQSSSVAQLGEEAESTPGIGEASEEYNKLRYQKNDVVAKQAAEVGGSAFPTIVSDQVVEQASGEDLIRQEQERLAQERQDAYQRLLEQRRQEEQNALQEQQTNEQAEQQRLRQEGFENLMAGQANSLFASWGQVTPQQYVAGAGLEQAADADGRGANVPTLAPPLGRVLYKAGDIVFAVLETGINSDEQGPVMARIVQGPLKGAKVIGTFAPAGIHASKLKLVFNVMSIPSQAHSIAFNAVAVDADVGRTALASNIDNHYLLRYGSLFASAFLEGMSDAVLSSIRNDGIRVSTDGKISGSSVKATSRDQVISGLGNIGKKIGENSNFFNRPPTITLDSGTGFGLLMISDLNIDAGPVTTTAVDQVLQSSAAPTALQSPGQTLPRQVAATARNSSNNFATAVRDALNQSGANATRNALQR